MRLSGRKKDLLALLTGRFDASNYRTLDWNAIMKTSEHSRTTPLLYRMLTKDGRQPPIALPDDILRALKTSYQFCFMKNTLFLEQFRSISGACNESGIAVIPLKGIYLLLTSFRHDTGIRILTDIDILVKKADREKADRTIKSLSPCPRHICENDNTIMYLVGNEDDPMNIHIHLHWHISNTSERFMALHRSAIRVDDIWKEARDMGDFSIMSPEHGLLALSEHALRHGFARLDLIFDIHKHVLHYGDAIDWERAAKIARQWNLLIPAHFGLSLSRAMFATPIPENVLKLFKPDGYGLIEKMLMHDIIYNDFPKESSCALFYLVMTKRLQDKFAFAGSLAAYAIKKKLTGGREYAHDNMSG